MTPFQRRPEPEATRSETSGLTVATKGMLSTIAESTADPNSSVVMAAR